MLLKKIFSLLYNCISPSLGKSVQFKPSSLGCYGSIPLERCRSSLQFLNYLTHKYLLTPLPNPYTNSFHSAHSPPPNVNRCTVVCNHCLFVYCCLLQHKVWKLLCKAPSWYLAWTARAVPLTKGCSTLRLPEPVWKPRQNLHFRNNTDHSEHSLKYPTSLPSAIFAHLHTGDATW